MRASGYRLRALVLILLRSADLPRARAGDSGLKPEARSLKPDQKEPPRTPTPVGRAARGIDRRRTGGQPLRISATQRSLREVSANSARSTFNPRGKLTT